MHKKSQIFLSILYFILLLFKHLQKHIATSTYTIVITTKTFKGNMFCPKNKKGHLFLDDLL